MKDNIYTIKRLCKELDKPRQKIRRRLINLNIKAINEDTRAYKNDPLKYDYQVFLTLAEEFNISVSNKEYIVSVENTTDDSSKDKLIKVLEEQLKESNVSRKNLEKLLDQQQQLTLMSNRKFESLKLEYKDLEVDQEKEIENQNKKKKWYDFFIRFKK